jgi:hypothetical protein
MTTVGFVLLTHSNSEQIERLVRVLNELYDGPPIACHHDFGQCALDQSRFPNNVRFVEAYFPTFWGCFAIVPAARAAIRLILDAKKPADWIYLLSGSDYPCASPETVQRMLSRTPYDAFIDHREITYGAARTESGEEGEAGGFSRASYVALAYRRYCAVAVPRPSRKKPFAKPFDGRSYLRHPAWRRMIPGPFSSRFRCYAGEHWFTVNRKAAEVLVNDTPESHRLLRHLQRRESPEECFHHSLLGNSSLRLSDHNLRYIHWPSADAWHPSTLSLEHLTAIRRSGAHFVRKVALDSPLLHELDRITRFSESVPLTAQPMVGSAASGTLAPGRGGQSQW